MVDLTHTGRRLCFMVDDDSHWYAVDAERRADFDDWLDSEDARDGAAPSPNIAVRLERSPFIYSFRDLRDDSK